MQSSGECTDHRPRTTPRPRPKSQMPKTSPSCHILELQVVFFSTFI